MEIKLKLNDVIGINNTLKAIIDDNKIKNNVLLKFRLLGVMKAIEPHIVNFEVIKNDKIMEYGEKNSDGIFQILGSNIEATEKFKKDIDQVLTSDVLINIETIKPEDLIDKGLNSSYLIGLFPIIRE